jgi:AcrR family transcriptional regulator
MAKRRSYDEEGMAAWAGPALIDGAELERRQAQLAEGRPEQRAAATKLAFGRAAIVMAGELGYEGVRVEGLIERAGSNRARFYAAFPSKEACFTWAYDAAVEAGSERLLEACESAPDWSSGMRVALEELTSFVAAEPGVARGLLAQPGGAGAAVAAKRMEVLERLSRAIDRARRETLRSRHSPPPVTSRFILSAINAAVLKFLLDPGGGDLEAELPGLLYLAIDLFLGPEAARTQVRKLRSGD